MQRKILALLLAALMCLSTSFLTACSTTTPETTITPVQTGTTPTESTPTTDIPSTGSASNPFESEIPISVNKKEHQMLEEIPSSYTLVGSTTLPPIDNQGAVGSCASESVAYMQFTNAVAQYMQNVVGDKDWKPSLGSNVNQSNPYSKYLFSPKFTYLFSSAGTAWVYNILLDHGCATIDYSMFHKNGTGSVIQNGTGFYKESLKWDVGEGELLKSLQYRITNYEQIWCTKAPYNSELTTSEKGRELVFKIKEAIASGNVVVTGGFVARWQTGIVVGKGTLGRVGDSIITYSKREGDGGHQVCLVGYDDNITTSVDGQILKGAFLMANSWGTSYGNNGYIWVAYDALNAKSEFEALNDEKYERGWTFDQFCFTYWDCDITNELPALMAEVEIETDNRESFYIELTREDSSGIVETYMPHLFVYGAGDANIHENPGVTNFSGEVDTGKKDTGYFTLSYEQLIKLIPNGKTAKDYVWGIKVYSVSSENTVTVKSVKLINSEKEVLAEITPSGSMSVLENGNDVYYKFLMTDVVKSYVIEGNFYFSNSSNYLVDNKNHFVTDSSDKATKLGIEFNVETNTYSIFRVSDGYVLDISGKKIQNGVEVRLNAKSDTRQTQAWKLYDFGDGTFAIYLASPDSNGVWYAVGLKDGETVLVSGSDVKKYGKWSFENSTKENIIVDISSSDGEYKLTVENYGINDITSISVVNKAGEAIKTGIETGKEAVLGKLSAGEYCVIAENPSMSLVYYFVVK